jgi:predicted RNA binding protein YcfA (HicA-like mRNA interferase family)
MKLPRDISGKNLVELLKKYDYKITNRKGDHIRLTTLINGEHHITIPDHNPIKIGTINNILKDVAEHFELDKNTLLITAAGRRRVKAGRPPMPPDPAPCH